MLYTPIQVRDDGSKSKVWPPLIKLNLETYPSHPVPVLLYTMNHSHRAEGVSTAIPRTLIEFIYFTSNFDDNLVKPGLKQLKLRQEFGSSPINITFSEKYGLMSKLCSGNDRRMLLRSPRKNKFRTSLQSIDIIIIRMTLTMFPD